MALKTAAAKDRVKKHGIKPGGVTKAHGVMRISARNQMAATTSAVAGRYGGIRQTSATSALVWRRYVGSLAYSGVKTACACVVAAGWRRGRGGSNAAGEEKWTSAAESAHDNGNGILRRTRLVKA